MIRAALKSLPRGPLLRTLLGLVLAAAIGAIVVVSGLIPIKASSGHWAITEWFLHFTMRRSIATHSIGIKPPPLDQPDLALKGAMHYEVGCRPCHGSPGTSLPVIPRAMTPRPPPLPSRISEMDSAELFYVVKHGVKFTGMPAWPALRRDDEVWAVVAFLKKLPHLTKEDYANMVATPAPEPPAGLAGKSPALALALQACARCHGADGRGRSGSQAFPILAGQSAAYLKNSMVAYGQGERHSGIMQPLAAALDADTVARMADHYASLGRAPAPAVEPGELAAEISRGRQIAHFGIPGKRVPSCVDCHAQEGARSKPEYPLLAGQPAEYLTLQLQLLKNGVRGGTRYAHLMHPIASRLDPEEMRAVALYFQSQ